MLICRRAILIGGMASALSPLVPLRASAIAPLAALQAGAAVVSIVTGIMGAISDQGFRQQLAEISAKIDVVVRLQQSILKEIQDLKLFITDALLRERKDAIASALNAQKDRFDILTAVPLGRETRPLYDLLISNVEQSAFEISRFDFSAYIPFSTGVAIDWALYRILGVDDGRRRVLKSKIHAVYEQWLDANSPLSVTSLINDLNADNTARTQQLAQKPRNYDLRSWSTYPRNSVCDWVQRLTVQGDFDTGFSAKVEDVRLRCQDLPDLGVCTPRAPCLVPPDDATLLSANIPTKIPDNSGYQQVDEFNRERNSIIDQMVRVSNLEVVKAQLERLKQSFT